MAIQMTLQSHLHCTQYKKIIFSLCSLVCCLVVAASVQAQIDNNTEYNTQPLADIAVFPSYQLNAQIIPLQQSLVSAQISGYVTKLLVKEGERVMPQQILAELDCFSHKNNLKTAQIGLKRIAANIRLLNTQLARTQQLVDSNNIPQSQLDIQNNQLEIAEISLQEQQALIRQYRKTVQNCHIIAPFSGVIIDQLTEVGETTGPSSPAFKLLNLDNNVLSVMVPQTLMDNLLNGKEHVFIANNRNYPVQLKEVMPLISSNRTQEVRFNLGETPVAGTQGIIHWQDKRVHLTNQYIRRYQGQLGVYLVSQGQLKFKRLGDAQESRNALVDLPLNSNIIVNPSSMLGLDVEIID